MLDILFQISGYLINFYLTYLLSLFLLGAAPPPSLSLFTSSVSPRDLHWKLQFSGVSLWTVQIFTLILSTDAHGLPALA